MSDLPEVPANADGAQPYSAAEHPHLARQRLTDGQALGALGAWYGFRAITSRIGLSIAGRPSIFIKKPWVIPLLIPAIPQLILAGTGINGRWHQFVATVATTTLVFTISGCIFYWAGWRFGHRLADMAKKPGSTAAAIWNPKQIARAERWMARWGIIIVFLARATEHFTLPVVLVAGASEMRFRRFFVANTAGAAASATLFLWIGVVAQHKWKWLPHWISHTYQPWAARIGIASLVLLALVFILGRFVKSDDHDETTTTPSQGESSTVPDED